MLLGSLPTFGPLRVIPMFYPMVNAGTSTRACVPASGYPLSGGDREKPCRAERRGGAGAKRVSGLVRKSRPKGFGPSSEIIRSGSFNSACVGSLRPGDRRSRLLTGVGDREQTSWP